MRSIKSFIYSTLCNLPQFVDCLINRNENAIHKCFFCKMSIAVGEMSTAR